jgi:hypothetical protein
MNKFFKVSMVMRAEMQHFLGPDVRRRGDEEHGLLKRNVQKTLSSESRAIND